MISPQWDVSDFEDDQVAADRPAPTLVSLHFIRSALRRRWLVCVRESHAAGREAGRTSPFR